MSYKYTVLQDKPIAFYLLDEVRSGSVGNYNSLSLQFATYQDLLDNGVSYSALSGLPIYDYSGNLNDGYAINASNQEIMPLIAGGIRGTKILSDTSVYFDPKGIATKYYADNSFSIEMWAKLPGPSEDAVLLADTVNNIGLFYENGNIVFKIGDNKTEYTYSSKESVYIVASFNTNSISLYINGDLADFKSLDGYLFTNSEIQFVSGPSQGVLVIDCVGFYKFNLSNAQMASHYNEGKKEINYSQIVNIDNGYLFSMNVDKIKPVFKYSYPESRSWKDIAQSGVNVSSDGSYVYFTKTLDTQTASSVFLDSFIVPTYLDITTSQVYWDFDTDGILVEVSIDEENWQECINGSPLPFFNKNDNQVSDLLYLRITLSSTDTSRYLPILKSFEILFYSNKDFYSDNYGYRVYSSYDYSLPKYNSRILSYNKYNGLKMYDGHGFSLQDGIEVQSVEVIFTPSTGQNVLFSSPSKIYEWDSSGVINKNGISSIYVNGIDRTDSLNIDEFFSVDIPHHVVINLSSPVSSSIKFNQNQDDTKSGIGHMYNNLAVYQDQLNQYNIDKHYSLYIGSLSNLIDDTSLTIEEGTSGNDSTAFVLVSIQPEATSV